MSRTPFSTDSPSKKWRTCRMCFTYGPTTKHHVTPRQHGGTGKKKVNLCEKCHVALHAAISNDLLKDLSWTQQISLYKQTTKQHMSQDPIASGFDDLSNKCRHGVSFRYECEACVNDDIDSDLVVAPASPSPGPGWTWSNEATPPRWLPPVVDSPHFEAEAAKELAKATPTPDKQTVRELPPTELPDGSGCFTATILSEDEAMALPRSKRPLNYRITSDLYHAIFEAVGTASMCWNPRPGDMVFDSTEAEKVAVNLCLKTAKAMDELADRCAKAEGHLGNLLARIHRDGEHYQSEHGTEKAVHDAEQLVAKLYSEHGELFDSLCAELTKARERIAELELALKEKQAHHGAALTGRDHFKTKLAVAQARIAELEPIVLETYKLLYPTFDHDEGIFGLPKAVNALILERDSLLNTTDQ
jgi:hypothetical protein